MQYIIDKVWERRNGMSKTYKIFTSKYARAYRKEWIPVEKQAKYLNKPFIIETKTDSKNVKSYLTSLGIRLGNAKIMNIYFLEKTK